MGGDGRRDGKLTVMDSATLRRWTVRRQLDGKGQRNGDSTTMDNKERHERDGDVDTAGSVEAKTIFPTLNSQNYIEFRDNIKVMATF